MLNDISVTVPSVWPFVLLCMMAWRLTSLLVNEAGPFDVFARLRDILGVHYNERSQCEAPSLFAALCCNWCTSIWVSAAICLIAYGLEGLLWALPMSTGVILIHRQVT